LTGFLHYEEEIKTFGKTIIPLVRQKEKELKEKAGAL
jgi:dimethylsulfone monooxygenase